MIRLAVIIFLLASAPWPVFAAKQDIIKKEKRLEDVQRQIREERKAIKEVSEKETNILGELEDINRNLAVKKEELKTIEESLSGIHREVAGANANMGRLEARRKALAAKLKARLRAMYKIQRGEAMEVLFSSDSSNLGRRHKYLTMIMDSDARLIEGYEENLLKLGMEKKKITSLYRDMEAAKAGAARKKIETEALQKNKLVVLSEVKQEKDRREKVVKELEQAAADLSRLIEKLRSVKEEPDSPAGTGFASMKGRLMMPVAGRIVSSYGKVKHPKFQTVTFNNGIVIDSAIGTPVRNVYDGKVIYVGWLKGYGQVMIIDHKGGFYTLFAYLSKTLKEKGDDLKGGETAALVGDTGPEGRPGLYFEIRQKGAPRDPAAWLSGGR